MDARNVLKPEDRAKIERAVAEAESKSSVEIVCAIATASGRYDRAESIVGLAGALLGLGTAHAIQGWSASGVGNWAAQLHLGWQAVAVVAGFAVGNALAGRIPFLRRLVMSENEVEAEVRRAAAHAFLLGAVANTAGRTGLLVYVSLVERRVVVLADEEVRAALGDEEISRLRDVAVAGLKRGDFVAAFVGTVEKAAPRLAEVLPADRQLNPNELPDHVLTFHPRPG